METFVCKAGSDNIRHCAPTDLENGPARSLGSHRGTFDSRQPGSPEGRLAISALCKMTYAKATKLRSE